MKRFIINMLFLTIFLTGYGHSGDLRKVYVGTYTSEGAEGIYLCSFNMQTGEIILKETFKGMDNPSFLKISPDKKTLYAVTMVPSQKEKPDGFVEAYHITDEGKLNFLNKQDSHGSNPCHVDVSQDGSLVGIATYGGGTISLYPVNEDGSLCPATSTIINEGSGPDESRQSAPHAHSIRFSPYGGCVFSADLGTDRVDIFELKKNKLKPAAQKYLRLSPGAGPRHFDFYTDEKVIYVINELNSTITAFKQDHQSWKELETVTTLPSGFNEENYCADIHVSPDGKFLYGSNRGHNSIAVFKINDNSHKLILKGYVSSRGNWPRNFTFSPDGKFLLVANQRSGNIVVFSIDKETGMPEFTGNELKLPAPVCLEFL